MLNGLKETLDELTELLLFLSLLLLLLLGGFGWPDGGRDEELLELEMRVIDEEELLLPFFEVLLLLSDETLEQGMQSAPLEESFRIKS